MSIQEYKQLELQTPQLIFEPLQELNGTIQLTPKIEKLMFLTPWNRQGYQLVLKNAHKFDYISPCWYDLSFSSDHIIIENDKLYNDTFVKLIKKANPKIKILPRFYISSNQRALLHSIGSFEAKFKQAISLIVTMIENQKFDGLVWDSPFNTLIAGEKNVGIRNLIVQFVNSIRMNLANQKLLYYNMANPLGHNLANDMYSILNVDCIMIQNYDNNDHMGMIHESINWAKSTKFTYKPKIMLLLPFFSRRGGQGIDSKQIQKAFKNGEKIGAEIQDGICSFFEYDKRMTTYLPCYHYFEKAFKLIEQQGLSMGFWQGGNGLDNYYKFL